LIENGEHLLVLKALKDVFYVHFMFVQWMKGRICAPVEKIFEIAWNRRRSGWTVFPGELHWCYCTRHVLQRRVLSEWLARFFGTRRTAHCVSFPLTLSWNNFCAVRLVVTAYTALTLYKMAIATKVEWRIFHAVYCMMTLYWETPAVAIGECRGSLSAWWTWLSQIGVC